MVKKIDGYDNIFFAHETKDNQKFTKTSWMFLQINQLTFLVSVGDELNHKYYQWFLEYTHFRFLWLFQFGSGAE